MNIEKNNEVMMQHIISLQNKRNQFGLTNGEFLKSSYNYKIKGTLRDKINQENNVKQ
jgi:hypothetical protein